MLFLVHADDSEVFGGHAFITEVTGHFLTEANRPAVTTSTLTTTDTTWRAVFTFRAVGAGLATEVPALHDALETLALAGADDIDVLDHLKDAHIDRCARGEGRLAF